MLRRSSASYTGQAGPSGLQSRTPGRPSSSQVTRASAASRTPGRPKTPSRASIGPGGVSKTKPAPVPETRPLKKVFELPALSTFQKKPQTEVQKIEAKRKVIRRNIPAQEDVPKLKEVLKSIRNEVFTVHEFVGLISPFTGDNGNIIREVLAQEIGNFRIMSRRIYDTMTQDVSDVLTNEHVQLIEFQNEKYALHVEKMMRAIDTILACVKDFNFEEYHENPEAYLKLLFPILIFSDLDADQQDMLLRQEAYHRLQWLRKESERLTDENAMLQSRLKELKQIQQAELQRKADLEQQAADERNQLEQVQDNLQDQLAEISTEVEKSMVESERLDTMQGQQVEAPPKKPKKKGGPTAYSSWAKTAAKQIEEVTTQQNLDTELSKQSVTIAGPSASQKSLRGVAKQRRKGVQKRRDIPVDIVTQPAGGGRPPRDTSPFHYSPPRTPPQAARQTSPFHYSPVRSPPRQPPPQQRSPFHYSPPRAPSPRQQPMYEEARAPSPPRRRVERTTTVVEPLPGGVTRRSQAPRDSWGGFY